MLKFSELFEFSSENSWILKVFFGFQEFWPNSDLNSSFGPVPRRPNLSTQVVAELTVRAAATFRCLSVATVLRSRWTGRRCGPSSIGVISTIHLRHGGPFFSSTLIVIEQLSISLMKKANNQIIQRGTYFRQPIINIVVMTSGKISTICVILKIAKHSTPCFRTLRFGKDSGYRGNCLALVERSSWMICGEDVWTTDGLPMDYVWTTYGLRSVRSAYGRMDEANHFFFY